MVVGLTLTVWRRAFGQNTTTLLQAAILDTCDSAFFDWSPVSCKFPPNAHEKLCTQNSRLFVLFRTSTKHFFFFFFLPPDFRLWVKSHSLNRCNIWIGNKRNRGFSCWLSLFSWASSSADLNSAMPCLIVCFHSFLSVFQVKDCFPILSSPVQNWSFAHHTTPLSITTDLQRVYSCKASVYTIHAHNLLQQ